MTNWLDKINDGTLIIIVFSILAIISLIGIKNRAYYSNDLNIAKTKNHYLNTKYKLYLNKKIDVDWINKIYGFMNVICAIVTPVVMLVTKDVTVGIVSYFMLMVVGNLVANRIVIKKYNK